VAKTGIGRENARERCAALIDAARPSLLIATGFAGGLRAGLSPGDILVANGVCEVEPGVAWTIRRGFVDAAARLEVPGQRVWEGRLLTVGKVLSSRAEKEKLGEALSADAVDMESSSILKVASEKGVPVVCVRAILDELDFDLPLDFGKMVGPDGGLRVLGALEAFAERPRGIFKLFELRSRALRAIKSLGIFLPGLLDALEREGA